MTPAERLAEARGMAILAGELQVRDILTAAGEMLWGAVNHIIKAIVDHHGLVMPNGNPMLRRPAMDHLQQINPRTVVKKVDFSRNDQENPPFAAPTVQDGSDRESHPETPNWSPLKPFRRPEPADQPEPDWIRVSASPAGTALQAPVSAAERSHPSTPTRASLASLQVR